MGEDIKTTDGLIVCGIGFVYWFGSLFIGLKLFDCWWNRKLKRKQQKAFLSVPSVTINDTSGYVSTA